MRQKENVGSVGCLLMGKTERMQALGRRLAQQNVCITGPGQDANLLFAAQEGLRAARRPGGACIAAEGMLCWAALALAAQLCVERIALIAPVDLDRSSLNEWDRQLLWLRSFARRNLFFCVSDVLVLEEAQDRRMDAALRKLLNARVHRVSLEDQRWTNCEHSPIDAAARFLKHGDFMFSLAKT